MLQRCLAKDPEDRWQNALDLKAALDLAMASAGETPATVTAPSRPHVSPLLAGAAALFLLAAVFFAFLYFRRSAAEPSSPTKFSVAAPQAGVLTRRTLTRRALPGICTARERTKPALAPPHRLADSSIPGWHGGCGAALLVAG